MLVVTNVHTDASIARIENGITSVSRCEIKFLPKTGMAMRNVMFAIFAQITSVGVDDRGSIVIDAGHLDLVNRDNENHLMFFRQFLHQANGGAVGDAFGEFIPAGFLLGAKIRAVKKFLKAEDFYFFLGSRGNQVLMFRNHFLFYVGKQIFFWRSFTVSLDQAAANHAGHGIPLEKKQGKSLPLKGLPYKPEAASFTLVIFRGTRAFLRGNSMEFVENKGIKYGAEVA